MKIFLLMLLVAVFTISCSNSDSNETNDQATLQTMSSLEGNWLLQNLSGGARLTFVNNNLTINSGTVTIKGTFTLVSKQMSGQDVSRSGANNGAYNLLVSQEML